MDITPYVESLRRDLLAATQGAGPELRQAAERLGFAIDPAARLALMEAISQADMPAGGVDVRLDGRDLAFVVHAAAPEQPGPAATPPAPPPTEEEGGVSRITLRLPESVKARAEEAATQAGQSLNTWLVNAVRAATHEGAVDVDLDLSSIPFPGDFFGGRRPGGRRMTGWL